MIPIWAPETIKGAPVRSRCQLSPLSADRGSELSHGRRDASRGTAEMRNDLYCANSSTVIFLHHMRSLQVRSYRRCELDFGSA
jgi:hypothetical protein